MLRYEFISKEWIVSSRARLVYRTAAVVSLTLLPLMAALTIDPRRPVLRLMLLLAILGTALNAIGMEFFLLRFDNSAALKQVFWFCALFLIPIGPFFYCFMVYSRSQVLKDVGKDREENEPSLQGSHFR